LVLASLSAASSGSSILPASTSRRVTLPATSIDPEKLTFAKLEDEDFAFDRTDVSDPPAKHFSDDIPGLFQQWHHSDLLIVNGRGIPIKFWPEFYRAKKGIKQGAWKLIRVEWGNWKVTYLTNNLSSHSTDSHRHLSS
jgi:hypothetical protein